MTIKLQQAVDTGDEILALNRVLAFKGMTYRQAKSQLWRHLESLGWAMSSPTLKVPHATDLSSDRHSPLRVWFKSQALYVGFTSSLGDARSLHLDIRETSIDRIMHAIVMYAVDTF